MLLSVTRATCAIALLTLSFGLAAAPQPSPFLDTGVETKIPFGWVDFCRRYPGECETQPSPPEYTYYNEANLRDIRKINLWVNKKIVAKSDEEHWGVLDQWDYPSDGQGDCEDYALLKRRLLVKKGFPPESLLLTVVKDSLGDGHMLLMVRTTRGDLVLDNLEDNVKWWYQAPYRFVKRQSEEDPNAWVTVGPAAHPPMYTSGR